MWSVFNRVVQCAEAIRYKGIKPCWAVPGAVMLTGWPQGSHPAIFQFATCPPCSIRLWILQGPGQDFSSLSDEKKNVLCVAVIQEKVCLENQFMLLKFNRDNLERNYEILKKLIKMGHFAYRNYTWLTSLSKQLLHPLLTEQTCFCCFI